MRRLRLFLTGALAFVIALNASILPTPAIPPIIRPPSAELPSAIADDFIISQQTPYSSGRNEVVVTSPSTDMVQRFWLSLPGEPFQLYELALSNVAVNNANSLISSVEAQTTPAKVQQRLKNFKAVFDNNALAEIELADGTKAIFSPQEVAIMQPDGRVAEVIKRRQSRSEPNSVAGSVWQNKSGQQIAKSNSCEKNTAREIALKSTDIKAWSTDIAAGWSPNIDWQDALATRLIREAAAALSATLQEATSNSVSLQKTTCKAPVQCGFRRDTQKEGISGNQVITDLFKVPTGATGEFNLDYEFFTVPDRLEISYNGEIKYDFGPTDGSGSQSFSLADVEQGFVGIRVIGNPDEDTEWWYEINCSCPTEIASADSTNGSARENQSDWENILNVTNAYYRENANNSAVSAFAYQMRTLAHGAHDNRQAVGGWAGDFTRNTLLEAVRDISSNRSFWTNPPRTDISFWESQFGYYCDNAPDIDRWDPYNNSQSEHDCGFARSGKHHFDRHLSPAFEKHILSTLSQILENDCVEDKVSEILNSLNRIESEHSLLLNSVLIPGLDSIPGISIALRHFASSGVPNMAIKLRRNTVQNELKNLLSMQKISQKDFLELEKTLDF